MFSICIGCSDNSSTPENGTPIHTEYGTINSVHKKQSSDHTELPGPETIKAELYGVLEKDEKALKLRADLIKEINAVYKQVLPQAEQHNADDLIFLKEYLEQSLDDFITQTANLQGLITVNYLDKDRYCFISSFQKYIRACRLKEDEDITKMESNVENLLQKAGDLYEALLTILIKANGQLLAPYF